VGDRPHPRPQVHISLQLFLESTPERGFGLQVVAVHCDIHVRELVKAAGLENRAEEVNGTNGREPWRPTPDRPARSVQDISPQSFPLLPALLLAAGVVLARRYRRPHARQCIGSAVEILI